MRKLLLLLFLTCFLFAMPTLASTVRRNIDSLFLQAPHAVLPLLDASARHDLLDLYANQLPARVENRLGGQSQLLERTNDYLSLQNSPASYWTMKIMGTQSDALILTVHSVVAGGMSSRLYVYDQRWQPVKVSFPHLTPSQCYVAGREPSGYSRTDILALIAHLPIAITLDAQSNRITYQLSADALDPAQQKVVKQCTQPLHFVLSDKHLVRVE